jgi:hypothetical protein
MTRAITLIALFAFSAALKCDARPGSSPAVSETSSSQRIFATASESVGKKMWYGFGLPSGKLGCAAALSNVLNKSGIAVAHSAAVVVVRRQLLKSSFSVTETGVKSSKDYGVDIKKLQAASEPGDLIFGYMTTPDKPNLGPDAHCGVIAGKGEVFANDWNDGIWKRVEADRFFAWYPHIYVMRVGKPNQPK